MRKSVGLLALTLMVVSATACEIGDVPGIDIYLDGPREFTLPQEQETIPFTAEG